MSSHKDSHSRGRSTSPRDSRSQRHAKDKQQHLPYRSPDDKDRRSRSRSHKKLGHKADSRESKEYAQSSKSDKYKDQDKDRDRDRDRDHKQDRERSSSRSPRSKHIRIPRYQELLETLVTNIAEKVKPSFRQSSEFWDDKIDRGFQLHKVIQSTEFTDKRGIAGIPIERLPLPAILFEGINNWVLRYVSSGKPTYCVLARNYPTSRFLHDIDKALYIASLVVEAETKFWAQKQTPPIAVSSKR